MMVLFSHLLIYVSIICSRYPLPFTHAALAKEWLRSAIFKLDGRPSTASAGLLQQRQWPATKEEEGCPSHPSQGAKLLRWSLRSPLSDKSGLCRTKAGWSPLRSPLRVFFPTRFEGMCIMVYFIACANGSRGAEPNGMATEDPVPPRISPPPTPLPLHSASHPARPPRTRAPTRPPSGYISNGHLNGHINTGQIQKVQPQSRNSQPQSRNMQQQQQQDTEPRRCDRSWPYRQYASPIAQAYATALCEWGLEVPLVMRLVESSGRRASNTRRPFPSCFAAR
jgi:hypothetical protein